MCNFFFVFLILFCFFCSDLFRIVANKQGKRPAPKRNMPGDENIALLGQGRGIGAKRIS